jgi:hypothetical protein
MFNATHKQGWEEGKGLGLNEQGMTSHIVTKKIVERRGTNIDII